MATTFNPEIFRRALRPQPDWPPAGTDNWPELNEKQIQAFEKHARLILETNKKFNLTRITDPAEMAIKHYLDSLTCTLAIDFPPLATVCDIGSGAGFPGIPLAIFFPKIKFTLLESQQKKAGFLAEAIAELGLANCQVKAERAEAAGRGELRESFDLVVARGVAVLPVAAEFGLPLTKIGGFFLAMIGKMGDEEERIKQIFDKIGGGEVRKIPFSLPGAGQRALILVSKTRSAPEKYPRRPGIPNKSPIS
jgi:16S rRNA (guanine527-N7)-methyltransferase